MELYFYSSSFSFDFWSSTGDNASGLCSLSSSLRRSHNYFKQSSISYCAFLFNSAGGVFFSFSIISALACSFFMFSTYQQSTLSIREQSNEGQSFMLYLSLHPMSQMDQKISLNIGSTITGALLLWSSNTRAHVLSALRRGETMIKSTSILAIFLLHSRHQSLPSGSIISQSMRLVSNFNFRYSGVPSILMPDSLYNSSTSCSAWLYTDRAWRIRQIIFSGDPLLIIKYLLNIYQFKFLNN